MGVVHLVFLITCTDDSHIGNCIRSISDSNKYVELSCMVLLQNGVDLDLSQYKTRYTFIETFYIDKIIPLSQARNFLISKFQVEERAYYMFPDDDSLFDENFFENFGNCVFGNTLIAVKSTQDKTSFFLELPDREIAKKMDYYYAISVNMIITGKTLLQVGYFDEKLGVGNYYGAGEDNDYFIRCNAIAPFRFTSQLWNYHPLQKKLDIPLNKLVSRYKLYGRGVIYMLIKHRMTFQILKVIIRGYCGCICSIMRLNPKMVYVYFVATNERLLTLLKNIKKLC